MRWFHTCSLSLTGTFYSFPHFTFYLQVLINCRNKMTSQLKSVLISRNLRHEYHREEERVKGGWRRCGRERCIATSSLDYHWNSMNEKKTMETGNWSSPFHPHLSPLLKLYAFPWGLYRKVFFMMRGLWPILKNKTKMFNSKLKSWFSLQLELEIKKRLTMNEKTNIMKTMTMMILNFNLEIVSFINKRVWEGIGSERLYWPY